MKKLSSLNESLLGGVQKKVMNGEERKEDGRKVHTCLGTDIYVSPDCVDYDRLIWEMTGFPESWDIDNFHYEFLSSDFKVYIHKLSDAELSPDELVNVRNFTAPYDYLIYDGQYGTSLIAEFSSYDEASDWSFNTFQNYFTEKDYINICRTIAEKLKEVGEYLTYIPHRDISTISINGWTYGGISREWQGEYNFKLIDESDIYNWICENDEEIDDVIEEYVDDMCTKFPELKKYDAEFICWSYRDGSNIGLPLSVGTLLNIQKYVNYTKEWFK